MVPTTLSARRPALDIQLSTRAMSQRTRALFVTALLLLWTPSIDAQPAPRQDAHPAPQDRPAVVTQSQTNAADAAHDTLASQHTPEAAAHGATEEHANPLIGMAAKLLNFGILVGTLVYFLKSPFATYLVERKAQIRRDLNRSADMRTSAAAQLAAVEAKLKELPGELDTLRRTGTAEVEAEEARLRAVADKERLRLIEQLGREIDLQGKAAERTLLRDAADTAVTAAAAYIAADITADDQARLQERYVTMVAH